MLDKQQTEIFRKKIGNFFEKYNLSYQDVAHILIDQFCWIMMQSNMSAQKEDEFFSTLPKVYASFKKSYKKENNDA